MIFNCSSDALSARYVSVSFNQRTARLAKEMMQHVMLAFLGRLPNLNWMAMEDKLKAADKLTGMALLIGATQPEKMLNYSSVPLSHTRHFENVFLLRRFNYLDSLRRLYERVDRERFQMPASQVNA